MDLIYKTVITDIGKNASEFIEQNMFIIFLSNMPEELRDYCYIHNENNLIHNIEVGDTLFLDEVDYKVTAVGKVVNQNLSELGHITFKFDGQTEVGPAGTLYLEQKEIVPPKNGTIIKVIRD